MSLLSLLAAAPAAAQLQPADLALRATEAARVVVGTVAGVDTRLGTNAFGDELIYSDLTVMVSETLKGAPASQLTVTLPGGTRGGASLRVSSLPVPGPGDTAVYLLNESPGGTWVPHAQGQGILRLAPGGRVENSNLTLSDVRTLVTNALPGVSPAPTYRYTVIHQFPHDAGAFTQGLELHAGALYEGTGLLGASTLRRVDLTTGTVTQRVDVPAQHFGEGITVFGNRIYQLTWLSGVGFIYDAATFAKVGEFTYAGEGWGLTHDRTHLIMSDGTSQIRFLDPASLQTVRTISVADHQGQPVAALNELEYVNGQILANVWQTDRLVRIDPESGRVTGWMDLSGLLPPGTSADVLNGIAYDAATGRLFVTGKLWPWLFQIALVPAAP